MNRDSRNLNVKPPGGQVCGIPWRRTQKAEGKKEKKHLKPFPKHQASNLNQKIRTPLPQRFARSGWTDRRLESSAFGWPSTKTMAWKLIHCWRYFACIAKIDVISIRP
jgi:hypothetical protein